MLSIVATPIGNLKDITIRALETMQKTDAIICEDSRRTSILLNHYEIKKPLIVLNDFNENRLFPEIISRLRANQNLTLVSDAGTPLISDPGYKLVREAIYQGIEVDSLPGPSSVITALTLSGLPPDKFLFLGYFPEKQGQRIKLLLSLFKMSEFVKTTLIFFASPYKIKGDLESIKEVFGDIELVIAAELTKIHQSVEKKTITFWLDKFQKSPKGEFIILFTPQEMKVSSDSEN